MTDTGARPSPMLFFEAANAYQRTAALKAAIELDLFTAIGQEGADATEAARKCGAAERGVRILSDYLTVAGFLTKEAGRYRLTANSAMFLDRSSRAYLGGALGFLNSPAVMGAFGHLTEAVRKGGTALPGEGTVSDDNPVWVDFARAMMPMMIMPAQLMAKGVACDPARPIKVLDIAAGHGIFGITLAQQNPNVEVVALDWAHVLEVASENARRMGVGDRHSLLPGSAFTVDFGTGYDLVLLTNFLTTSTFRPVRILLRKVRASLAEGGRAVTLEFVVNEDRVTPAETAPFSLIMLASTPGGDAYTFSEYQCMFENAGFTRSELHPLPPSPNQMIISYT